MYILKLKPVFKDYLWGGTKLRDEYGFKSYLTKLAEGWMLSCHKDGENIIDNGEFSGKSLTDVVKMYPEFLGKNGKKFEYFPILIKLIDAKQKLSVQVHPSQTASNPQGIFSAFLQSAGRFLFLFPSSDTLQFLWNQCTQNFYMKSLHHEVSFP